MILFVLPFAISPLSMRTSVRGSPEVPEVRTVTGFPTKPLTSIVSVLPFTVVVDVEVKLLPPVEELLTLPSFLRRSSIQSTKKRPGDDCDSDHEFLITKFRLKLKKVGKTARPFRYGQNQIPLGYTVEVRNRFKGLNLIECLMNYGMRFMTLYRRQGSRT